MHKVLSRGPFQLSLHSRSMRAIAMLLIGCAIPFGLARDVRSQSTAIARIELYATGLDSNLDQNPAHLPVYLDFQGDELCESASITSYGGTFSTGLHTFKSYGSISAHAGRLGATAGGSGTGWWDFAPHGGGFTRVSWGDTVYFNWVGGGEPPPLPDDRIVFRFHLEGRLAVTALNGGGAAATAHFRTGTAIAEPLTHTISIWRDGVDQKDIRTTYDAEVSIRPDRSVLYRYGLDVGSWSRNGFADADFRDGMVFASITFPDGTTPESHGWELVFDSGLLSPNIGRNTPPVAHAGENQEVPCTGHHGALLTLDGSGSFDPDDDALQFEWSVAEDSGIVIDDPTAEITEGLFPVGVHEVMLAVYDLDEDGERQGTLDVASVTIVVFDDTPPVALVTTNLAALWPANNKLIPVELRVFASDHCTAPDGLLVHCTITSSQPDDTGDTGEHVGDVDGDDGYEAPVSVELENLGDGEYAALVHLRAEHDGDDKAGRVYSINVSAIDLAGNEGHATSLVVVPHNQGGKKK